MLVELPVSSGISATVFKFLIQKYNFQWQETETETRLVPTTAMLAALCGCT